MRSVTGAIRSTVVTLSSSAENTAVTTESITRIAQGRASTRLADQIAMNRPRAALSYHPSLCARAC